MIDFLIEGKFVLIVQNQFVVDVFNVEVIGVGGMNV